MAIQISMGVDGMVKEIQPVSISVDGMIRNVTEGYMGVDGMVKQIYQDGLTLYDYGKTDYTLAKYNSNSGGYSSRGTIASDHCYINSGSVLGNTDGNSGLSSHLGCPQFIISGISEFNATDILKYTQLEVTYSIGEAFSSLVDNIVVSFGGWAGHQWDYDSDLETKGDSYYWQCRCTHDRGTVGTFTKTLDITSTKFGQNGLYGFLRNAAYCGTTKYKERAINFYFGAYTYANNSRDWFCKVPVYFYSIRLL